MSDVDYVPSHSYVDSDALLSMNEVASGDEEVVRAALQLREACSHTVLYTEAGLLGKDSDVRFDFGPLTESVLELDFCVDIFRMNFYTSHLEARARFTLPDADSPVEFLPDVPPPSLPPFVSS